MNGNVRALLNVGCAVRLSSILSAMSQSCSSLASAQSLNWSHCHFSGIHLSLSAHLTQINLSINRRMLHKVMLVSTVHLLEFTFFAERTIFFVFSIWAINNVVTPTKRNNQKSKTHKFGFIISFFEENYLLQYIFGHLSFYTYVHCDGMHVLSLHWNSFLKHFVPRVMSLHSFSLCEFG